MLGYSYKSSEFSKRVKILDRYKAIKFGSLVAAGIFCVIGIIFSFSNPLFGDVVFFLAKAAGGIFVLCSLCSIRHNAFCNNHRRVEKAKNVGLIR